MKGNDMKDIRVLIRKGARDLTPQESDRVFGAIHTETVCTLRGHALDGDVSLGEC